MRDPLGLNERLFALWYPPLAEQSEKAGLRDVRAELLAEAHGRTLEIGAGSGLNLPHYTAAVTELVLSEPSPHMRDRLRRTISDEPPEPRDLRIVDAGGERLPFDDASFDTVVSTFVHCTIPDPAASLREIARVLAPGGRLLFVEHVHAGEGTLLGRVQDLVELPHRYIAAGCHPNRRFEALLDASPLTVERVARRDQQRAIPTVKPTVVGVAVKG